MNSCPPATFYSVDACHAVDGQHFLKVEQEREIIRSASLNLPTCIQSSDHPSDHTYGVVYQVDSYSGTTVASLFTGVEWKRIH